MMTAICVKAMREICATIGVDSGLLHATLAVCRGFTPAGVFALAGRLYGMQLAAQDNLTPVHQAILDNLALLGQG